MTMISQEYDLDAEQDLNLSIDNIEYCQAQEDPKPHSKFHTCQFVCPPPFSTFHTCQFVC